MSDRCLTCQLEVHSADAGAALLDHRGQPCSRCPQVLVTPQPGVDTTWDVTAPVIDPSRVSAIAMAAHLTATGRMANGRWEYGYTADGGPIVATREGGPPMTFTARAFDETVSGAWLHWRAFGTGAGGADDSVMQHVHMLAESTARASRRGLALLAMLLTAAAAPRIDGDA